MCGICGYISKQNITLEQLKRMNDTMYHRGPNDSGEEIYALKDGYTLGLGQRRLSILDLSSLGHQPMHSQNGRVSVVYNGECYNFLELKEELSDYPFQSNCDTEVIIAAYLKWGISCIAKLKGMFAIALFDRETDELFLIRDRIGKKPLYYWYEKNDIFFASELKPIMEAPNFCKNINQNIVKQYMYQAYINAPNTIFENVYKLEPGGILKFKAGKIEKWKYWDIATVYQEQKNNKIKTYQEAKEGLKDKLIKATRQRMIADVPLGTFLSGGYDSSLVTAIAQSLTKDSIKTFSIGFQEEKYNEAKYAKEVSNYLGTNHTEYYITEQEMFEMVESIPMYYDEPFADSSQIPTMLVSRLAKEKVTVALSGDGGDEFFCGYNVYDVIAKAQKLDGIGEVIYRLCQLPLVEQLDIIEKMPFSVRSIVKNRNPLLKTQLTGDNYIRLLNKMIPEDRAPIKYEIEDKYQEKNWQIRRMLLDMDTYLSGDILCKVDRAAMKYSLETRCPILDVDVMEYSFRIPHSYKYRDGKKKYILKDIVYDYIPKELLERPKVGFSVPLDKWLRGPLREELMDYANEALVRKQGIFNEKGVQAVINQYMQTGDKGAGTGQNYSRLIWAYYVFQKWYQAYGID